MSAIIIIPAHMASQRFPGKPLVMIAGKPLIQHVYERAKRTKADQVLVATCDDEIWEAVGKFGGAGSRTAKIHSTGTHRVAEVLETCVKDPDLVINWQVDEPFIDPEDVNKMIDKRVKWDIETMVAPLEDPWNYHDVKVSASNGMCYWFSRAPMNGAVYHVGIYMYKPAVLRKLSKLKPTILSKAESLEQLAWIEAGHMIGCIYSSIAPVAVNVKLDLDKAEKVVEKCQSE